MQRPPPPSPKRGGSSPKAPMTAQGRRSTSASAKRQLQMMEEEKIKAANRERERRSVMDGVLDRESAQSEGLTFCERLAIEIVDRAADQIVSNHFDLLAVHYTAHSLWDSMLQTISSTFVTHDSTVQARDIDLAATTGSSDYFNTARRTSTTSVGSGGGPTPAHSAPASLLQPANNRFHSPSRAADSPTTSPTQQGATEKGGRKRMSNILIDATLPYVSSGAHDHHNSSLMMGLGSTLFGGSGSQASRRSSIQSSRSISLSLLPSAAEELLRGLDLGILGKRDESVPSSTRDNESSTLPIATAAGTAGRSALKKSSFAASTTPLHSPLSLEKKAHPSSYTGGRVAFKFDNDGSSSNQKVGGVPQALGIGFSSASPTDTSLGAGGDSPSLKSAFRVDPAVSMPDYELDTPPEVVRGKWRADQPPRRVPCDEHARSFVPLHIKYMSHQGVGVNGSLATAAAGSGGSAGSRRRAQTGVGGSGLARVPSAGGPRGLAGTVSYSAGFSNEGGGLVSAVGNLTKGPNASFSPRGKSLTASPSMSRDATPINFNTQTKPSTPTHAENNGSKTIANLITASGRRKLQEQEQVTGGGSSAKPSRTGSPRQSNLSASPGSAALSSPDRITKTRGVGSVSGVDEEGFSHGNGDQNKQPSRGQSAKSDKTARAASVSNRIAATALRPQSAITAAPSSGKVTPAANSPTPPSGSSGTLMNSGGTATSVLSATFRSSRVETPSQKASRIQKEAEAAKLEAARAEKEEESTLPPDSDIELHRQLRERMKKEKQAREELNAKREAIEKALANPQVSGGGKPFIVDGSKGLVLSVLTVPTSTAGKGSASSPSRGGRPPRSTPAADVKANAGGAAHQQGPIMGLHTPRRNVIDQRNNEGDVMLGARGISPRTSKVTDSTVKQDVGDVGAVDHPFPHTSDGVVLKGATPRYIISSHPPVASGFSPSSHSTGTANRRQKKSAAARGTEELGKTPLLSSNYASAISHNPSPDAFPSSSPREGAASGERAAKATFTSSSAHHNGSGREKSKKDATSQLAANFFVPESTPHMLIDVMPSGGVSVTELTPRPAAMQQQMEEARGGATSSSSSQFVASKSNVASGVDFGKDEPSRVGTVSNLFGSPRGGGNTFVASQSKLGVGLGAGIGAGSASSPAKSTLSTTSQTVGIRRQSELVFPKEKMQREDYVKLVASSSRANDNDGRGVVAGAPVSVASPLAGTSVSMTTGSVNGGENSTKGPDAAVARGFVPAPPPAPSHIVEARGAGGDRAQPSSRSPQIQPAVPVPAAPLSRRLSGFAASLTGATGSAGDTSGQAGVRIHPQSARRLSDGAISSAFSSQMNVSGGMQAQPRGASSARGPGSARSVQFNLTPSVTVFGSSHNLLSTAGADGAAVGGSGSNTSTGALLRYARTSNSKNGGNQNQNALRDEQTKKLDPRAAEQSSLFLRDDRDAEGNLSEYLDL